MRPALNHQVLGDNWLLPQQLLKESKRFCKDFLCDEEDTVTKVLAGAHEGNRVALR